MAHCTCASSALHRRTAQYSPRYLRTHPQHIHTAHAPGPIATETRLAVFTRAVGPLCCAVGSLRAII
eukprot:15364666-Alexandrium_andersonii.AAC.1